MYTKYYLDTGGTATNAGIILIPMMVGSVVGSQVAGQSVRKFSYRAIMLVSVVLFFIGMALLSTLDIDTSRKTVTFFMIIAGLGMGCSFSLLSMAAQHKIEPQKRGIATSTNTFFRTLGMTIGVTIFGSIQNHVFKNNVSDALGSMKGFAGNIDSRALLSADARTQIPPDVLHKISEAMAHSVATTFKWTLIPIFLGFIAIILMGKERLSVEIAENRAKKAQ